jgi:hypothetical protein
MFLVFGGIGAIICALLGVITNGMTMLVILKQKKVRDNLIAPILFMMCLSNFVFSLVCLPLRALQLFGWFLDESFCQYFPLLYFPTVFVSILTCALISLNRALALKNHALAKRVFTWKKTILYYNLMWLVSIGVMMLPFYKVWGKLGLLDVFNQCALMETESGNPQNGLFSISMGITIPVVVFSVASIYCWMRSSTKEALYACGDLSPDLIEQFVKHEAQVTKTSLVLVGCFAILYIPNFLIAIFIPIDDLPGLHIAGYMVVWCWVFVNPVIYVVGNRSFRLAFKITFGLTLNPNESVTLNLLKKPSDQSAKLNWKKMVESEKKSSV